MFRPQQQASLQTSSQCIVRCTSGLCWRTLELLSPRTFVTNSVKLLPAGTLSCHAFSSTPWRPLWTLAASLLTTHHAHLSQVSYLLSCCHCPSHIALFQAIPLRCYPSSHQLQCNHCASCTAFLTTSPHGCMPKPDSPLTDP